MQLSFECRDTVENKNNEYLIAKLLKVYFKSISSKIDIFSPNLESYFFFGLLTFLNIFSNKLFIISLFYLNIIFSLFFNLPLKKKSFFLLPLFIHSQQLYFPNLTTIIFSNLPTVTFPNNLFFFFSHIFQTVIFYDNHILQQS